MENSIRLISKISSCTIIFENQAVFLYLPYVIFLINRAENVLCNGISGSELPDVLVLNTSAVVRRSFE